MKPTKKILLQVDVIDFVKKKRAVGVQIFNDIQYMQRMVTSSCDCLLTYLESNIQSFNDESIESLQAKLQLCESIKKNLIATVLNNESIHDDYIIADENKKNNFRLELLKLYKMELLAKKIHSLEQEQQDIALTNKPIKWNGSVNELATMFYDMKNTGLIECSNQTITDLLSTCFVKENGEPVKRSTIEKHLKEGGEKSKNRVDFKNLL